MKSQYFFRKLPQGEEEESEEVHRQRRRSIHRTMRHQMALDLRWMTAISRSHHVEWTGNMTDLVELVHTVWASDEVIDPQGRVCQYNHFLCEICRILGVRCPREFHTLLCHAHRRKGIRVRQLIDRYADIADQHEEHPIRRFLHITPKDNSDRRRPHDEHCHTREQPQRIHHHPARDLP